MMSGCLPAPILELPPSIPIPPWLVPADAALARPAG